MIRVPVDASGQAHDVLIGPLADAADRLRALAAGRRLPLVSDERILGLHGGVVAQAVDFEPLIIPEGEAAKGWETLQWLIDQLVALGTTRSTPLLALGGGSIGDVAGLAAALFKRGCPIVHLPTTLLAQVDGAIGGKTAIDAVGQKNLVGVFHAPALVVADPAFLDTLDDRQLRAGYAELVKYGLIDSPDFFAWCERNGPALLTGDSAARNQGIAYAVAAKARFVAEDFHDRLGRRALLNLGHTFGHAIEAATSFGPVLHGEAVALGMCLAFDLSVELSFCAEADRDRVRTHLSAVGLPTKLADVGVAGTSLLPFMRQDKKVDDRTRLTLILTRGIGQAFVSRDIGPDRLADFLARSS